MKRIGILGGSSQVATIDYYQRINAHANRVLGGWNSAEMLISSMNFQISVDAVEEDRWDTIGDYLADRAKALEQAGADLLICVSNTLHCVADRFTRDVAIPFVHIADPTAAAIRASGLERAALFGTRTVMAAGFLKAFYRRHGVEIVVPDAAEQDLIHRIIFDELCRGQARPASKATFLTIAERLRDEEAGGLILGCTEIPLLIDQGDLPDFPMFDTVGLHVEAVMQLALADELAARS